MMLKGKFKFLGFLVISSFPMVILLNGCGNDISQYDPDIEEQDALDHFKYINDRTISLMSETSNANGSFSFNLGTGWLFDYDPKTDLYYVITNMHVAQPMIDANGSRTKYKYGYIAEYSPNDLYDNNSLTWNFNDNSNYKQFQTFELVYRYNIDKTDSNYYYDNSNVFTPDMAILKVGFQKNDRYFNNRLNDFQLSKKGDRFYNFYDWGNTYTYYNNKIHSNKEDGSDLVAYIAGFPSTGGQGTVKTTLTCAYWTMDEYYPYRINNTNNLKSRVTLNKNGSISSFNSNNINYFGQQNYVTLHETKDDRSLDYNPYYLTGGSSGSMVINENYEVLGIYWGGWGIGDPNHFDSWWGSFATFSGFYYPTPTNLNKLPSNQYNFIDSFYSYI